jgi:hypothetical protein
LRLSTSLQKNILEATAGGVFNNFLMRRRRLTLFFEDIIAEYIFSCEKSGRGKELRRISQRWGELTFTRLLPGSIKKLPINFVANNLLKESWKNLGIVDDLHIERVDRIVDLSTKNESITRVIGGNEFMCGFFTGTISALYGSESNLISFRQDKGSCDYRFELGSKLHEIKGKDKAVYDKLNYMEPIKGFTLNDAVRRGIFELNDGYKIYFRGKRLTVTENTIFHLAGDANVLLEFVPSISYDFFNSVIAQDSTGEQKLTLLKNLLQVMGWGLITIIVKDCTEIKIEIRNPPYGLQPERDNWIVLGNILLGYLRLIDNGFEISNISEGRRCLELTFSAR